MSKTSHIIYLGILLIEILLWYSSYREGQSIIPHIGPTFFVLGLYWGVLTSTLGKENELHPKK